MSKLVHEQAPASALYALLQLHPNVQMELTDEMIKQDVKTID